MQRYPILLLATGSLCGSAWAADGNGVVEKGEYVLFDEDHMKGDIL